MTEHANYKVFRLLCLDPVHVGIGQDITGEVDLPIDREPESGVPRIPGSTLKGGYRSHVRWKLIMQGSRFSHMRCPGDRPTEEDEERPEDAPSVTLCGTSDCPICQTFGWPEHSARPGNEGRVFFSDARLAFFPAVTDHGTLWFSTPGRAAAYLDMGAELPEISDNPLYRSQPELAFGNGYYFSVSKDFSDLLVGWIEIKGLPYEGLGQDSPLAKVVAKLRNMNSCPPFPLQSFWKTVSERTVLLEETSFYRVVETCLERRTCNRIDEDTGTVVEGALFSYEALPRYTLLYSRMTWETDRFPLVAGSVTYHSPLEICDLAREGLARMGIGGLQTRGLGSILVEPLPAPRAVPEALDPEIAEGVLKEDSHGEEV